jgi:cell division septal protein FtsQ
MSLEDDPIIWKFFNTPEKKAKWIVRFKIFYLLWICFMILGIVSLILWFLLK